MLLLSDRNSMMRALTLDLDLRLKQLLAARISSLVTADGDLTDWTEYVIIEPGDDETDIEQAIGSSPTVDPVSGARFGEPGFAPHWDWLAAYDGWFEMTLTFGGDFAYVLFVADDEEAPVRLVSLCRKYAGRRNR